MRMLDRILSARHTLQYVCAAFPFMVALALAASTIEFNLSIVWHSFSKSDGMPTADVFLLVMGPFFFQLWRCWFLIPISFILIGVIELLARRHATEGSTAGNDNL